MAVKKEVLSMSRVINIFDEPVVWGINKLPRLLDSDPRFAQWMRFIIEENDDTVEVSSFWEYLGDDDSDQTKISIWSFKKDDVKIKKNEKGLDYYIS
jgi:hypothetical protein